jgi:glyoxylase-like metal-dependent hydrolase (beta-lactamase superfamily II)
MRVRVASLLFMLLACGLPGCQPSSDPASAAAPSVASLDAAPATDASEGPDEAPWWSVLPREGWAAYEHLSLEADQGWFDVYRVAPGTYAILESGHWQEVILWLIEGEARALLFDTGLGIGDVRSLVASLTDLEVVVLNSHTHFDHVGGNHQFETLYGTDLPFAMANAAGGTHEEGMAKAFTDGAVWKPLPTGFDQQGYRTRPWTLDALVQDGQRIDLGGRVLEVLFTPGHSPDSLSLFDASRRMVFVGDTLYPAPLYAHLEGSDFEAYRASAARLSSLADRVDLVATGHNEPVADGAFLTEAHDAFEAVAAGLAPYEVRGSVRVHDFGRFAIITAAP